MTDLTKGSANDQLWGNLLYSTKDEIPGRASTGEVELIRTFKTDVNVFKTACGQGLTHAEVLMLYGQYYAFKNNPLISLEEEAIKKWQYKLNPFRHLRNLLETSNNELRPENIYTMLLETEKILDGNITSISLEENAFNKTQFLEEFNKAKNADRWVSLYSYENHDILRGALSLFCPKEQFNIKDDECYGIIKRRLETFAVIFNKNAFNNDRQIRAELLSIHDYSQKTTSDVKHGRDNRMLGRQYGSWREMFLKSDYYHQTSIMAAIDQYKGNGTPNILPLDTRDWRYYATQKDYYNRIYFSYSAPGYGYVFFIDAQNKPLECYLLQSTSSYDDNVMWKLLNRVLWENLWHKRFTQQEQQSFRLRDRKYWQGIDCQKYVIDADNEGWRIYSDYQSSIMSELAAKGYETDGNLIIAPVGVDYIEFGLKVYDDIKSFPEELFVIPDSPEEEKAEGETEEGPNLF